MMIRVVLGLLALVLALPAAAQGERDVKTLVAALQMPRIAAMGLTFGCNFSQLDVVPTPEQARAERAALEQRTASAAGTAADWARLGEIYTGAGERVQARQARDRAIALYETALKAQPDDAGALIALGGLLARRGEATRGEELLTRAVTAHPESLEAAEALVALLAEQALPRVTALRQLQEQYHGELERAGAAAANLETPQAASASLQGLRGAAPGFAAAWEKIAAQPPTPAQLQACREAAARCEQWVLKARPLFRQALAAAPAAKLLARYLKLEMTGSSTQVFAAALAAGQTSPEAGQDWAQAVMRFLAQPGVLETCQEACSALPGETRLRGQVGAMQALSMLLRLATSLAREEKAPEPEAAPLAQAESNLRVALPLPPADRPGILAALVFVQTEAGRPAEAVRLLDEAFGRGEWDFSAYSIGLAAAYGVRLSALMAADNPAAMFPAAQHRQAAQTIARWLERVQPAEADAWALLASVRARAALWEGVMEPLARARRLDPAAAKFALAQGIALLKLGQAAPAEAALREALTMRIDDAELCQEAHHALGVALYATGKAAEGERELNWKP